MSARNNVAFTGVVVTNPIPVINKYTKEEFGNRFTLGVGGYYEGVKSVTYLDVKYVNKYHAPFLTKNLKSGDSVSVTGELIWAESKGQNYRVLADSCDINFGHNLKLKN